MKKTLALVFVAALSLNANAANTSDNKYFEIKKVTVKDVTDQYPEMANWDQAGLIQSCDTPEAGTNQKEIIFNDDGSVITNPLDLIDVVVDKIINIGKKIWTIVDAGRPVANVKVDTANALPKGVKCWSDLTGWKVPKSKVYQVQYENGFGSTVVDFAFRVVFTAGGTVNGKGKYITNATIQPAHLDVSWGFTFNAEAAVPSVFNTGTKEDPVAGMQMVMKWSVDSVLSHSEQAETFYVGGDNKLVHLE